MDVASSTKSEVFVFTGHDGPVESLTFSWDGKKLISCSSDKTALLWDVLSAGRVVGQPLTAKELQNLWEDIGSAQNSETAYRALCTLARGGKEVVAFLAARVKAEPVVKPEEIARLVANLGKNAKARALAGKSLLDLGPTVEAQLRGHLQDKVAEEVKEQLKVILDQLEEQRLSAKFLRKVRAIQVLEYMGSPKAEAVLQALAEGWPHNPVTQDARAALGRLRWNAELRLTKPLKELP